MKICTRCKKRKGDKFFRVRCKVKNNKAYHYRNPTCKKCDSEITSENYHKKKNDVEFIKSNRIRANAYRIKNWNKVKEKLKEKRQTPEYKAYVIKYSKQHKDVIAGQNKTRNLKYIHKIIAAISDAYVVAQLRTEYYRKTGVCAGIVFTKSQILERRRHIAIHRLKKLLKQLDNEEQNRRLAEPAVRPDGEADGVQA